MQYSTASCHIITLWSKSQQPHLKDLQSVFFRNLNDRVPNSYEINYIVVLTFLDSRRERNLNGMKRVLVPDFTFFIESDSFS